MNRYIVNKRTILYNYSPHGGNGYGSMVEGRGGEGITIEAERYIITPDGILEFGEDTKPSAVASFAHGEWTSVVKVEPDPDERPATLKDIREAIELADLRPLSAGANPSYVGNPLGITDVENVIKRLVKSRYLVSA